MNSAEIHFALARDECTKYHFAGVFASDALADTVKEKDQPACYVANTDPSSKPGRHWVAFYFPRSLQEPAELFDSFGTSSGKRPPFTKFLRKYGHTRHNENPMRLQGAISTACGQYCIYYLTMRCRGFTMHEIMDGFSVAPEDWNWNDSVVVAFVNKHFRLSTDCTDYPFLVQSALPHM